MSSKNKYPVLIISLLLFLFYIIPFFLKPERLPSDDAYFYLQIACNIVKGNGSTFNEITPTNGYHPLWMGFCIAGSFVSGADKYLTLIDTLFLQIIIFVITVYFFIKITGLLSVKNIWLSLSILAFYFFTSMHASEGHINGLFVITSIYLYLIRSDKIKTYLLLGLSLSLMVLSRLDNIFIAIIFFFLLFFENERTRNIFFYKVFSLLLFGIVTGLYLLYNRIYFGGFTPISGAIKSSFPEFVFNFSNLSLLGVACLIGSVSSVIYSFFTIKISRKEKNIVLAVSLGSFINYVYIVCFTYGFTQWPWYYVPGVINISLLLLFILRNAETHFKDKLTLISRGIIILSIIISLAGIYRVWNKAYNPDRFNRWATELAGWMNNNLPERSVIYVQDFPGILAYFTNHKIFSADGLTADLEYQTDLMEIGIHGFLKKINTNYLLMPRTPDSGYKIKKLDEQGTISITMKSWLFRKDAGELILTDKLLVANLKEILTPPVAYDWGIWKY